MSIRQAVCAGVIVLGFLSLEPSQGQSVSNVTLVAEGDSCQYLIPADGSLGLTWVQTNFDDSAWLSGPSGVGYEIPAGAYSNLIQTTVPVGTRDVYCRWAFDVPSLPTNAALTLHVRYDDGFVAYLNGTQVTLANATNPPGFNSLAVTTHASADPESFDIRAFAGLLQPSNNVLAIQVENKNTSARNSNLLILPSLEAGSFRLSAADMQGHLAWTNSFPFGVVTKETAPAPDGPWSLNENYYTTGGGGTTAVSLATNPLYCRLLQVDISSNCPFNFTNLVNSYGDLEWMAGKGQNAGGDVNQWSPAYEGGYATNAALSLPHIMFGDTKGNIIIADEASHSVLKVTADGRIHTIAGTHVSGNGPDYLTNATSVALNLPNGGWLMPDGTYFVLDTGNGKIRVLETNGMMHTLFTAPSPPIQGGRGLYVNATTTEVWYCDLTTLYEWTPTLGSVAISSGFTRLGGIAVYPVTGDLLVSDWGASRVYLVTHSGVKTVAVGNGSTNRFDGVTALSAGLINPRGVWLLPNGGFFIIEDYGGDRIWYVDPNKIAHIWVNGSDTAHGGDGAWFYNSPSTPKVQCPRGISVDPFGNILFCESNYSYIRRIRFQRLHP